ncbi:MAG: hypothetical protein GX218_00415 [Clostridiaceae bacterium]|nr:hypothetical protein [Clostridiaceae bacterium]
MRKQLRLPSFYSSGMILQQQVSNQIRGRGVPGSVVSLSLDREPADGRPVSPLDSQYGRIFTGRATCDEDGYFSLDIPPLDGSFDPLTLTIEAGKETVKFVDLLLGEVWVAAGQSSMQMPLAACCNPKQLADITNMHNVRILTQAPDGLAGEKAVYDFRPHDDLAEARWIYGDQTDLTASVSAIAYSFARELQLDLRLPVAILETALGGTHIHAWISRRSADDQPVIRQHIEKLGYHRDEQTWNMTGGSQGARHQPAALFNSKIAPLAGLGVRGILWYHGESDYQYPDYYQAALHALVSDWQTIFRAPDRRGLGFLFAQLKPHFFGHYGFDRLAIFNEMLAACHHSLKVPTALVPTYHLPLDYDQILPEWSGPAHPTAKMAIGRNLKTVALGLLYQRKAPASAPECADIEIIGGKLMISFDNLMNGLSLPGNSSRVRGFKICGPDRIFHEAQARLLYGIKVLVWHDRITDPRAVSYAHADLNQFANLMSKDHLAVVPFRSDRVPSRLSPPMEWLHCEDLMLWCCPDFARPEQTGWHPAWQVERGEGRLTVEPINKSQGDGSLLFEYKQADTTEFSLEPMLGYDSQFPPLDLSAYDTLTIDVFNPDQQFKSMGLLAAAGQDSTELFLLGDRLLIQPALRWQMLAFSLESLTEAEKKSIHRLVFLLEDKRGKGSLYLDNIQPVWS